jgi:acetyl-CoA carboxylase biotin carboxyl carrier protein
MGVGRDLSPMAQRSEPQEGEIAIKAPMVGTFYRSPKPGDPPFVEEGHAVGTDSIVCIIEVMKLMNSLHAGIEGVVTRILVQDAQAVEYGQPLMFVRKSAA